MVDRNTPTRPADAPAGPGADGRDVILFDGVCNLCNRTVQFIIWHDHARRFRFASLQSEAARRLLAGIAPREPDAAESAAGESRLPDSILLVRDGNIFSRSDASLRIARSLGFPWRCASWLLIVPRPLRDRAYRFIAARRYRWFGRRETCMVPTPDLADRFLR